MTSSSEPRPSFAERVAASGAAGPSAGHAAKPAPAPDAAALFERRAGGDRRSPEQPPGFEAGLGERRAGSERRVAAATALGSELPPGTAALLAARIAQREAELEAHRAGLRAAGLPAAQASSGPPPAITPCVSPYARFIPREEIGQVAAYPLDEFRGGRQRPQLNVPPDADTQRRQRERAQAEAEAAAARASAQAEAARQQALDHAREEGYLTGRREGEAALQALREGWLAASGARLDAVFAQLQVRLDQLEDSLADRVATLALTLARQVVRTEIASRPELVAGVAQEAVQALVATARQISLHLHPQDQAVVAEAAGELLKARGVRLLPDRHIEPGGCLVEADNGLVDATLATRWQRVAAILGREADVPWQAAEPTAAATPLPPREGAASAAASAPAPAGTPAPSVAAVPAAASAATASPAPDVSAAAAALPALAATAATAAAGLEIPA